MRTIAKMFGKSPFGPLREFMNKISSCVELLPELFEAFVNGNDEKVMELVEEISYREHEADIVKINIRSQLPHTVLMPVSRRDILEVISNMDAIADLAEDTAVLVSMKKLRMPQELRELFFPYLRLCMNSVDKLGELFSELDELLQASFGGPEAQKINDIIDEISLMEHKADIEGRQLARKLFSLEKDMNPIDVFLFFKIFNKVADLSNFSEKVANRIRVWLLLK